MADRPSHPLLGIGLMLVAVTLGSTLDATAKWLAQHYSAPQVVCVRFAAQTLAMLALAPWVGLRAIVSTRVPGLHLLRGLSMILASGLFVAALAVLPLATSVVLGQTSPLIAAAIAVPLLGERVGLRHWLWVLLGFAGVVVVLRPAPEVFGWAVVLPIASAASYAIYQVATKRAAAADPAVGFLLAACVAPFFWSWPTPLHAAIMLVHGAMCGVTHFLVIRALTLSPVSLTAPFGYAGLLWAVVLGFLAFGEEPDLATILGGATIALAGILLAREAMRARARAAP